MKIVAGKSNAAANEGENDEMDKGAIEPFGRTSVMDDIEELYQNDDGMGITDVDAGIADADEEMDDVRRPPRAATVRCFYFVYLSLTTTFLRYRPTRLPALR